MNPRNTFLLVLLAAGAFVFIFYVEPRLRNPPPPVLKVLPWFRAADVTSISVRRHDQSEIRAERSNGVWRLTAPLAYPVIATNIDNLLTAIEELSPQTRISALELQGHKNVSAEFGFDAPSAVIILQQGDDSRQLWLGNRTGPGDQIYARGVGMESVDVIDADFMRFVPPNADVWRDTEFVNLKDLAFDQLIFTNKTRSFKLQRPGPGKPWKLDAPKARADDPKIRSLLDDLQTLRVVRFETDETNAYLERYGLQPPDFELKFLQGTNQNPVFSLQIGKSPTATNTDLVYARRNDQSTIVVVPAKPLAAWRADTSEFRDRHLVRIAHGAPDVLVIEVQPPKGEMFRVERWTNGDWIASSASIGFQADDKLMTAWLTNMDAMTVVPQEDGTVPVQNVVVDQELPKYGLDTNANVLKYFIERFNEPRRDELDFGFKDGNVYARRGDLVPEETSVYRLKAEDVARFPTNILQLRERRVWKFEPEEVTNLTIRAKGTNTGYAHLGVRRWLPANGIMRDELQRFEMEEEIDNLAKLEALNWVERDPKDRAKYGFTTDSVQVALTIKKLDETATISFELGGQSPSGVYVLTKVDGQEWVFEMSARDASDVLKLLYIEERH